MGALMMSAADAVAQSSPRIEISGGGIFAGGVDLGNRTAQLTSNTPAGTPSTFFVTGSDMKSAPGVQGRLGFFVTRSLAIEGGVRIARPKLEVSITNDVESAANIRADETVSQYLFDGSAVWHFKGGRDAAGTVPFLFGGAGYLRELHEEGALVEEGAEYHAGGGVKWWHGPGRAIGIRVEASISIRDGGVDAEGRHVVPVAAGYVAWRF